MKRASVIILPLLFVILALCSGCVERILSIKTRPPGATVWLNDQEIGTTPLQTEFLFYGDYDVTIRKDNWETLHTHHRTPRPFYQILGLDFISDVLLPFTIQDKHQWEFELQPLDTDKDALLQRATQAMSASAAASSSSPQ